MRTRKNDKTTLLSLKHLMLGTSLALLAACGGEEIPEEQVETRVADEANETAQDVETATEETEQAAETAAEETAEVATNTADEAGEMAAATVDSAEGAMDDAISPEDTMAAADAALDETTEGMEDGMQQVAAVAGDLPADHPALGGDPAAGKNVFKLCMGCHSVRPGENRVGPSLYGIIGREAGTVAGFRYSEANAESGIVWTKDVLFEYLEDPQGYIPGTRMAFGGLKKEEDRRNVIAYLDSVDDQ